MREIEGSEERCGTTSWWVACVSHGRGARYEPWIKRMIVTPIDG